jgi:hypothetical protein
MVFPSPFKTLVAGLREAVSDSRSVRKRRATVGSLSVPAIVLETRILPAAPTDLSLSANLIAENSAVGTEIGTLSTTDADVGDSFTYELVSGDGSTDNASFAIVGDELRVNGPLNFELKTSYSIRVQTTDSTDESFAKVLTIQLTNVDETSVVTLSGTSVAENSPVGTAVGNLGLTDAPDGEVQYKLVGGEGASGNGKFKIVDGQLVTKSSLNTEKQSSYSVRVQATDAEGNASVQVFEINVTNVNEAITGITFHASPLSEDAAIGTLAGTLSVTDLDGDDSVTYTLVAGVGDADNAMFAIDGDRIETASLLDFETKSTFSVRVRATDGGGMWVERVVTIRIRNVNEAPTGVSLSNSTILSHRKIGTMIGKLSGIDPDGRGRFKFELVDGAADNAQFQLKGNVLKSNAEFNAAVDASYTVRVRVTDANGLTYEQDLAITVIDEVLP